MEAIEDHWPGYWANRPWPTRDGIIPWRYCLLLLFRLRTRRVQLQLRQIETMTLAFALTQPGTYQSAQVMVNRLTAELHGDFR